MRARRWRLSPPICGAATIRPSFAATGRGWRHPMSTCRRTAPGRRARWPEIQGHAASATAGRPAMAPSRSGAQGARPCQPRTPRGSSQGRGDKLAAGPKNRRARVPKGNPLGRETAPEGPGTLLGPSIGCGVGTRAPVAPSPTRCQRGWWCWRDAERRDSGADLPPLPMHPSGPSAPIARIPQRTQPMTSRSDSRQLESALA